MRKSSALLATLLLAVSSAFLQPAQAEESNFEPKLSTAPINEARYEASVLEDGAILVDIENAKFSHSPEGDIIIVDANGNTLETLPTDLADYEIVGRNSLVASKPGTLPGSNQTGTSFRGICPLGHHSDGGCRGGGVVKGAGKGIITGAAGGCAAGAIPSAGAGCPAGALAGGIAGGVAGAIEGATGW